MVGSIFHSRYCRIAIGSVVRPGPTRNRLISRLPNEVDEAEQRGRDDARPDGRQGDAAERGQRSAPRFCAASSTRAVEAGEARGDEPHDPGMTISMWPAIRPPSEPRIGQPVAISVSTWNIERDAEHDARHDQRQQQQAVDRLAAAESARTRQTAAGTPMVKPISVAITRPAG